MNYDKIKVQDVTLIALPEQAPDEVVLQAIGYVAEKGLTVNLNFAGIIYQISPEFLVSSVSNQHGAKEAAPIL